MLLKRVLTAIFPCQYCFVDLNVSARIPFLSPWFWLRCTKQSQCSTIAVPSSVLLRAVGLSPSPIRLPIDAEKRRAVSGKGVVEMIGPVLTCLQIVLHIFCILTKPRLQTKLITEPKNWKVHIVHIWRLILYFFRSWVLLHSPRQISGLPKLPPIPSDAFWGGNNAQGDEIVGTKKEIAKG